MEKQTKFIVSRQKAKHFFYLGDNKMAKINKNTTIRKEKAFKQILKFRRKKLFTSILHFWAEKVLQ